MAFIKRHLMLLSCGLLGLLSLVGMVVGILVGDVSAEMQKAQSLSKNLTSLGRDCVNDSHIKLAEEKSQKIAADYKKVAQIVKTANARPPLRDKVFPTPERPSDALGFREAYRQTLDTLLQTALKAKAAPDQNEVNRMRQLIAKERADAIKKGLIPPGGAGGAGGPGFNQPIPPPGVKPQGTGRPAPPTIEELAQSDADVRMSLVRAHETLCYASSDSLHRHKSLLENKDIPDSEQMWDAQMSLWIQQDVLTALAKVNEVAVAKLQPDDRWVANTPVKELIAIRVGDYVLGPGAGEAATAGSGGKWAEASGNDVALPPGDASAVFTGRTSNELYDVIQFAVELVIDARELPAVLDALSGINFFTPLTVSCSAPTVVPSFRGKVYGPSPVMRVRIEMEGCFFRELYHFHDGKDGRDGKPEDRFMPKSLSDQIVQGQRGGRDGRVTPGSPASPVRSTPRPSSPSPGRPRVIDE